MIRTGWLAALLLIVAPWTCLAQFGNMGNLGGGPSGMRIAANKPVTQWTVKVETFGNQSVIGKVGLDSVVVKCELGTYAVKASMIQSIELAAVQPGVMPTLGINGSERKGTVVASNGEKVTGTVCIPDSWKIETDLGVLTPDPQQLKSFTFTSNVPAQASKPGDPDKGGKPNDANPKDQGQPSKSPNNNPQPSKQPSQGEKSS